MSDPEIYDPNWGIEYCKSYAEQLKDKTRANRAEHAAECIEYLLSLLQKEWQGLTDEEIEYEVARVLTTLTQDIWPVALGRAIEAKLKDKNNG